MCVCFIEITFFWIEIVRMKIQYTHTQPHCWDWLPLNFEFKKTIWLFRIVRAMHITHWIALRNKKQKCKNFNEWINSREWESTMEQGERKVKFIQIFLSLNYFLYSKKRNFQRCSCIGKHVYSHHFFFELLQIYLFSWYSQIWLHI